ncbi:2Fe-2S iron-sulfur cluster-binding protein [Mycobacteroides salmoniphilum]|uniref:2Fe-2S iron-sulfur cluster-binding protein n=1 Tax=Mycobacteroides salmoniphilum TaxID=404941 RepID=UPI001F32376F|nr:2Fe-2S iron-sulfur cluster binding domain-containing protein [Mycobacteroides salmoniphilum]
MLNYVTKDSLPQQLCTAPVSPSFWRAAASGSRCRRTRVRWRRFCRQGVCGTCAVKVLPRGVEHRDTLLTAPERDGGAMLSCVSRCTDRSGGGELVLDL